MSRKLLLAATLLAAPALLPRGASAQPVNGLYIGAGAGANFMQTQQDKLTSPPIGARSEIFTSHFRSSFETGYAALGSVGWGFGNGVRVEVEGNYRRNDVHNSGNIYEEKYGGMANALFDLDVGSPYIFPYIGAGVGYGWAKQVNFSNEDPGSFAYQAIAGLSFPIPWVVGLSLTAEYRYYALAGSRSYGESPASYSLKTKADYNHDLMLGLRYAFNVAPPPPPAVATAPAPVVEAARTYLVFFDWDRADLSDRARQIIAEAAQATTRVQVTRIEVNGYTDTSGTATYNQGLSVRRAQTVANELVRDGVPRQAISTQGFGETHPLVPTAQGVREPQNRRVEIMLH